jgi:membrane associated rhomboid family serine protease
MKQHAMLLGGFVLMCWIVLAVDAVLPGSFAVFGVVPRSLNGLRGIPLAPLLHGNVAHLMSNTVPLLVLGALVLAADDRRFLTVTLWSVLGAGLAAWLLGAPRSVHIGASGVVFGYLGFLLSHGWFARRVGMILVSLFVAGVWGGLVFGVLPGQSGVSWQSHAGGFVAGVFAARHVAKRPARRKSASRSRATRTAR